MEKDLKKESFLDEGMANIGYTLPESIMEAIDDGINAKAKDIQIKLFKESFTEFKESEGNNNFSNKNIALRCSYIVCDNGVGIEDLENVFNFGNKLNVGYSDKDDYMCKNGRFHYGIISHINVGAKVILYSKTESDNYWRFITLNYDRYANCAYISRVNEMSEKDIEELISIGIELPEKSGVVLYVKGVRKTEFNYREIEILKPELVEQVGITYYDYLCNNNISIDDISVKELHPLGENLTDNFIKPYVFATYEISLNEVLSNLDDNIVEQELISKFKKIFNNKEEMVNETIRIKLSAININFTDCIKKINSKFPCLEDIYKPIPKYSGFYIKRNGRYIGRALGMLGIVKDHPKFSKFRGEISFSPIFDEFFNIQINKNRNTLSKTLIYLIQRNIEKDKELEGGTASAKIESAIRRGKDNKNFQYNPTSKMETRIRNLKATAGILKRKLENYIQDTKKVDESLILLHKEILENSEVERIGIQLAQLNIEYEKNNLHIYKDVTSIIKRVLLDRKRKSLRNISEETEYVHLISKIKEPLQEGELYGVLYLLYIIYPDRFDFKLLGYDTDECLDCLVKIHSALFYEMNFNERFGEQMNKINDEIWFSKEELEGQEIEEDSNFCLLELKLKLTKDMNHSLALVSHIVCWSKSSLEQIKAYDDLYGFTDSSKTLLINSIGGITKTIKVIYLKDIIEDIACTKFKK